MADEEIDPHYSRALDEIYRLRTVLAIEARRIGAYLVFKRFPKSQRPRAERQITWMQAAARGESEQVYPEIGGIRGEAALRASGASETLTRAQWEAEPARAQAQAQALLESDGFCDGLQSAHGTRAEES